MKKFFLLLFFLGTVLSCAAQLFAKRDSTKVKTNYTMPEFPGGRDELFMYLNKNVNIQRYSKLDHVRGNVYVSFFVTKEGKIENIKVTKSLRKDLDSAAVSLIMNMPTWKPGMIEGKPIRVKYALPVYYW